MDASEGKGSSLGIPSRVESRGVREVKKDKLVSNRFLFPLG